MIRVCILTKVGTHLLKKLLDSLGFESFVGEEHHYDECDVVLADTPMNISKPVVIYERQKDIGAAIVKATVAKLYAPLNDSVNESLELIRKK